MASTKDNPGAYDALEKAAPNEPIFVLLARDHAAPFAITEWARVRRNRAIHDHPDNPSEQDTELLRAEFMQCGEAEAVAMEMTDWRAGHGEAPPVRATYNALERSAAELAEADARRQREAAQRHLREAAFHLGEAVEWLRPHGFGVGADALESFMVTVNRLADAAAEMRDDSQLPLDA
jgi:hypothetical protein